MTRARLVTLTYGGANWNFTPGGTTVEGHQYYFESLDGWFGGVGVRSNDVDRGGHGSFQTPAQRTGRTLTLRVSIIVPKPWDRDPLVRRMSAILWDGDYGTLTVENDLKLSCPVRLDGEPGIVENGDTEVMLQLPLWSPDPWLYAPDRVSYSFPVGVGVGLAYPLGATGGVLTYGDVFDADQPVTNHGSVTSYPAMHVYGDFPGGFQVTAAGKTVSWPWPTDASTAVQIEHSGSVWIGDQNVTQLARLRQWMPLAPRETYTPRLHALQGGTGYLETHQSDTYV